MPEAQLVVLDDHRKRLTDEAREEGRKEGKRQAQLEYAERREHYHSSRMRVHARWMVRGIVAIALLTLPLAIGVQAPLRIFLLCLITATAVFTVFHMYYWDRHFEAS